MELYSLIIYELVRCYLLARLPLLRKVATAAMIMIIMTMMATTYMAVLEDRTVVDGTVVVAMDVVATVVATVVAVEVVGTGGGVLKTANIGSDGTVNESVHAAELTVNGVIATQVPFLSMYGAILLEDTLQLYLIVTVTVALVLLMLSFIAISLV